MDTGSDFSDGAVTDADLSSGSESAIASQDRIAVERAQDNEPSREQLELRNFLAAIMYGGCAPPLQLAEQLLRRLDLHTRFCVEVWSYGDDDKYRLGGTAGHGKRVIRIGNTRDRSRHLGLLPSVDAEHASLPLPDCSDSLFMEGVVALVTGADTEELAVLEDQGQYPWGSRTAKSWPLRLLCDLLEITGTSGVQDASVYGHIMHGLLVTHGLPMGPLMKKLGFVPDMALLDYLLEDARLETPRTQVTTAMTEVVAREMAAERGDGIPEFAYDSLTDLLSQIFASRGLSSLRRTAVAVLESLGLVDVYRVEEWLYDEQHKDFRTQGNAVGTGKQVIRLGKVHRPHHYILLRVTGNDLPGPNPLPRGVGSGFRGEVSLLTADGLRMRAEVTDVGQYPWGNGEVNCAPLVRITKAMGCTRGSAPQNCCAYAHLVYGMVVQHDMDVGLILTRLREDKESAGEGPDAGEKSGDMSEGTAGQMGDSPGGLKTRTLDGCSGSTKDDPVGGRIGDRTVSTKDVPVGDRIGDRTVSTMDHPVGDRNGDRTDRGGNQRTPTESTDRMTNDQGEAPARGLEEREFFQILLSGFLPDDLLYMAGWLMKRMGLSTTTRVEVWTLAPARGTYVTNGLFAGTGDKAVRVGKIYGHSRPYLLVADGEWREGSPREGLVTRDLPENGAGALLDDGAGSFLEATVVNLGPHPWWSEEKECGVLVKLAAYWLECGGAMTEQADLAYLLLGILREEPSLGESLMGMLQAARGGQAQGDVAPEVRLGIRSVEQHCPGDGRGPSVADIPGEELEGFDRAGGKRGGGRVYSRHRGARVGRGRGRGGGAGRGSGCVRGRTRELAQEAKLRDRPPGRGREGNVEAAGVDCGDPGQGSPVPVTQGRRDGGYVGGAPGDHGTVTKLTVDTEGPSGNMDRLRRTPSRAVSKGASTGRYWTPMPGADGSSGKTRNRGSAGTTLPLSTGHASSPPVVPQPEGSDPPSAEPRKQSNQPSGAWAKRPILRKKGVGGVKTVPRPPELEAQAPSQGGEVEWVDEGDIAYAVGGTGEIFPFLTEDVHPYHYQRRNDPLDRALSCNVRGPTAVVWGLVIALLGRHAKAVYGDNRRVSFKLPLARAQANPILMGDLVPLRRTVTLDVFEQPVTSFAVATDLKPGVAPTDQDWPRLRAVVLEFNEEEMSGRASVPLTRRVCRFALSSTYAGCTPRSGSRFGFTLRHVEGDGHHTVHDLTDGDFVYVEKETKADIPLSTDVVEGFFAPGKELQGLVQGALGVTATPFVWKPLSIFPYHSDEGLLVRLHESTKSYQLTTLAKGAPTMGQISALMSKQQLYASTNAPTVEQKEQAVSRPLHHFVVPKPDQLGPFARYLQKSFKEAQAGNVGLRVSVGVLVSVDVTENSLYNTVDCPFLDMKA